MKFKINNVVSLSFQGENNNSKKKQKSNSSIAINLGQKLLFTTTKISKKKE